MERPLQETALIQFCNSKEINLNKVMAFGSDGAAVMIGQRTGVSARLKERNPLMINIHCVAHRLALAASQASDDIPYLKKFKNIIHNLYLFTTTALFKWLGFKKYRIFWEIQY